MLGPENTLSNRNSDDLFFSEMLTESSPEKSREESPESPSFSSRLLIGRNRTKTFTPQLSSLIQTTKHKNTLLINAIYKNNNKFVANFVYKYNHVNWTKFLNFFFPKHFSCEKKTSLHTIQTKIFLIYHFIFLLKE